MTRSAHSLCLHMNDDDQSLRVGICDPPHSYNESTKVQNPRRNSYAGLNSIRIYTAHACTSASLPRVGLRLYLACFTPVAPVASL